MKYLVALLLGSIMLVTVGCHAHGDVDTNHDHGMNGSVNTH